MNNMLKTSLTLLIAFLLTVAFIAITGTPIEDITMSNVVAWLFGFLLGTIFIKIATWAHRRLSAVVYIIRKYGWQEYKNTFWE